MLTQIPIPLEPLTVNEACILQVLYKVYIIFGLIMFALIGFGLQVSFFVDEGRRT